MISLVRVDSRLIHGQVVEAWLPYLKVSRILVADAEAAGNRLTRTAMGLAVPGRVSVEVAAPEQIDFAAFERAPEPTLLLVRDIGSVLFARRHGLVCPTLNLGNVHFSPGRDQITPSVFLSPEELDSLEELATEGVRVEVRAVPREKPLPLSEVLARRGARAPCPRD